MPTAKQFFSAAQGSMFLTGDPEAELVVTAWRALNATQQMRLADAMQVWSDVSGFRAVAAIDDADLAHRSTTWLGSRWQNSLAHDWTRVAVGDIAGHAGSYIFGTNKAWGAARRYHEIYIDSALEGVDTFQLGSRAFKQLLHEIGHSVLGPAVISSGGIGNEDTVMREQDSNDPRYSFPATPMTLDIDRAIALYGATTSTRTGDDTYGFNAHFSGAYRAAFDFSVNTRPLVTIFDNGGNDTLNASGFRDAANNPRPVSLDLNQGQEHGSFLLDGRYETFAIIYTTTWIENAVGGGANDRILGNSHANRLFGGPGNDNISGGGGLDLIAGGKGKDTMTGGTQDDTFLFNMLAHSGITADTRDIIMDFKTSGADRIDVSEIDANGTAHGDTFTFLASAGAAFTAAGQIRWYQSGGDTYVEASTDADAAAEFSIKLAGLKMLSAGDFVL